MSEALYVDRIRHFNEERRLVASYLKSITPDATTLHNTAIEARGIADAQRALEDEFRALQERERRLSLLFDQKTELIYKAKAAEDDRLERIEFLSKLPPMVEVERDTTYYYRDNFHVKSAQTSSNLIKNPIKVISVKRIISGKEAKLEKDLQREVTEINGIKNSINRYLDSVEIKAGDYTSIFNTRIAGLKAEAIRLIAEAERIDLQSYQTVIDLLSLRLKIMVIQREEVEDSERLEKEIRYYTEKEMSIHMQLNNEVTEMNKKYELEILENLKEYQHQLNKLTSLEARLLEESKSIEGDTTASPEHTELLKQEAAAKKRYEKLRVRNALEMEGFNSESLALRQRLASIERKTNANNRSH